MKTEQLEQIEKLFNLLKGEILDLDIRNCDAEVVNVRIAELAERLVTNGVVVEEVIPQF